MLVLGEVIFDIYEEKFFGNVYEKYIFKLEKFVGSDRYKYALV